MRFTEGFRAAGGDEGLLGHVLDVVVVCESRWDVMADNQAGHRGLTQFSAATWAAMMDEPYFDAVFDPFLHGVAVARLIAYVQRTPGSTYLGQWSTWNGC